MFNTHRDDGFDLTIAVNSPVNSLFNFPEKDWEDILAKTGQRFME